MPNPWERDWSKPEEPAATAKPWERDWNTAPIEAAAEPSPMPEDGWGTTLGKSSQNMGYRIGEAIGGGIQAIGERGERSRQEFLSHLNALNMETSIKNDGFLQKGFSMLDQSSAKDYLNHPLTQALINDHPALREAIDRKDYTAAYGYLNNPENLNRETAPAQMSGVQKINAAANQAGEVLTDVGKNVADYWGNSANENQPNVEPRSAKYYAGAAIEGVGSTMIPAVVTTYATRGRNIPTALMTMTAQVTGASYAQSRKEGLDPHAAMNKAVFDAFTETASEAIPLGVLTREGGKLAYRVFKGAAAEGIQETINEAMQMGYDAGVLGKDMSPKDAILRLMDAGIIGAVGGAGLAVPSHIADKIIGGKKVTQKPPPPAAEEQILNQVAEQQQAMASEDMAGFTVNPETGELVMPKPSALPAAAQAAPQSVPQDPAGSLNEPVPEWVAPMQEPDAYHPEMNADGWKASDLAEQLDMIEDGAGEAILSRAEYQGIPIKEIVTELEGAIRERTPFKSRPAGSVGATADAQAQGQRPAGEMAQFQSAAASPAAPIAEQGSTQPQAASLEEEGRRFHQESVGNDQREGERRKVSHAYDHYNGMAPADMVQELVTHELTGIKGRRAFDLESGDAKGVVSIDADSLKWFNDNMSPDAGDRMLQHVADSLAKEFGAEDAYHISGDEFYVLDRGEGERSIRQRLERVQAELGKATIAVGKDGGKRVRKRGVAITYGYGRNKGEADTLLKSEKVAREHRGERVARGDTPHGVTTAEGHTGRLGLLGQARKPTKVQTTGKANAHFAGLERGQLLDELLKHELTGIKGRRAFAIEVEKATNVVSIDADSLKWINDNMSPDNGDRLLQHVADALVTEFGEDRAYHISGDEFYILAFDGESTEFLNSRMQKVQDQLNSATLTREKQDGRVITKTGLVATHAIAEEKESADAALKREKIAREERGERAGRGEEPPGVSRNYSPVPAESEAGGQADGNHAATGPEPGDLRTGPGEIQQGRKSLTPQAPAPAGVSDPEAITPVKDTYGTTRYVRQADLDSNRPRLRLFHKNGIRIKKDGWIIRENLNLDGKSEDISTKQTRESRRALRKLGYQTTARPSNQQDENRLIATGHAPFLVGEDGAPKQNINGVWAKPPASAKAQETGAGGFAPTHELPDGTLVRWSNDEDAWEDKAGDIWEDDNATPIEAAAQAQPGERQDGVRAEKSAPGNQDEKAADAAPETKPESVVDTPAEEGAGESKRKSEKPAPTTYEVGDTVTLIKPIKGQSEAVIIAKKRADMSSADILYVIDVGDTQREISPEFIAGKAEGQRNEPEQLDQSGAGTLERASTNDVPGAQAGREAGAGAEGGRGADAQGDGRAGAKRVPDSRGMGDDAGAVSSAATGEQRGRTGESGGKSVSGDSADNGRDPAKRVESKTSSHEKAADFVITPDAKIGEGGAKTKFNNNLAAIQLLKTLRDENRPATRDEQQVLAKYVGWGGIPQAFYKPDGTTSVGWEKQAAELKEVLTEEQLAAAARSTQDAHYTAPEIVAAIWGAAKHFGFKGGKVLEPSVGTGNFIGLMPVGLRSKSSINGVELDNITGEIAQHLYPSAKIASPMGFQDYTAPDNYFDLAIGNPPFGSQSLYDGKRKHLSKFSIHNYFFAKSVDTLKPNGVLAMVVSNSLMDKVGDKQRRYIADHTELLGAIRLPNNAFLKNAGTEVTTDIIFLRKLAKGEKATGDRWMDVKQIKDENGVEVPLNEYFIERPDMMLGKFGAYGSMYRAGASALIANEGQDTATLISEAVAKLKAGFMSDGRADPVVEKIDVIHQIEDAKVGSVFMRDGEVYIRTPDHLGEAQAEKVEGLSGKGLERVTGMVKVRDALARLRKAQLTDGTSDNRLSKLRKALNTAYDNFTQANGPINLDANKRVFRDDPTWPQIAALEENYDKGISAAVARRTGEVARKPSAEKAAIFTKRTQSPYKPVESASSPKDALVASLSELGRVDMEYVSRIYGKSEEAITTELAGLIYKNPLGEWEPKDQYLSGNVKQKLAIAEEAAKEDPAYRANVEALREVQPTDIDAVDINIKPGAHWIPEKVMSEFLDHITGGNGGRATYAAPLAQWSIRANDVSTASMQQWGTDRTDATAIFAAAVNQKQISVRDRVDENTTVLNETATTAANEKVERLKEEWRNWVWQDDARREQLHRIYNDTFNTDVQRIFDGSHLKLPGKIGDDIIKMRPHQLNGVWRQVQSSTTLLDHVVGAGKTFTMIAGAMEMRRMGVAQKPMFVVPNHLVGQWAEDFSKLYPGANVLAATKKDFEKGNRKRLFARIATGDWDAVIVAHSSFGKVEVDPQFQERFINEQIRDIETAIESLRAAEGKDTRSVKQVEKQKERLEEKLKRLFDAEGKDDNLYFSELGVDAVFLDEAHEFKNLGFATGMSRVAGLGNPTGSQKAADLFMKVQQLRERNGRVVFATGTPISNTMAEMYTMKRYLAYDALKSKGVAHFDAWARQYGEVVSDWELSPSGQYKLNSRFSKFVNMPELMQDYLGFGDVINRDDINRMLAAQNKKLPVPKIKGGKPNNRVVERSDDQAEYIGIPIGQDSAGNDEYPKGSLVWRAEHLPKKAEKGADNMLKIMSDARKAALDMRLIDPSYGDNEGSKINESADEILRLYHSWDKDRGVQLVFIDLSTPKAAKGREVQRIRKLVEAAENGDEKAATELEKMSPDELSALESDFSVYDDLRQKLIEKGIPESEVAYIHDANTELQKEELFGKVRSGRIRVLLGSTAKMGAGMNVQERLVALHHLDAPWRPSDLEQREGRIIRQGNKLYDRDPEGFEIEILRYATKQTLDSRMWQTIESKARFIEQVRKGATGIREVEDVAGEASNAAEMKAASSGNPLILEEMELRTKIRKLEGLRSAHDREQYSLRDKVVTMKRALESGRAKLGSMRQDAKSAEALPKDVLFTIDGKDYDKFKDAGARMLLNAAKMEKGKEDTRSIGKLGDFEIILDRDFVGNITVTAKGEVEHQFSIQDIEKADPTGTAVRLSNIVKRIPEEAVRIEHNIEKYTAEIPKLEKQTSTWDGSEELEATKKRHAEVIDELKPKKEVKEQNDAEKGEANYARPSEEDTYRLTDPAESYAKGTVNRVKRYITPIRSTWGKNMPTVHVVANQNEFPAHLNVGEAMGVHDPATGHIWLNAEYLGHRRHAEAILMHEAAGHYAAEEQSDFNYVVEQVKILEDGGDARVTRLAERIRKDYPGIDDTGVAKEVIAKAAEEHQARGKLGRLMRKLYAGIRAWLKKKGFSIQFTNTELDGFIAKSAKWLEKDTGGRSTQREGLYHDELGKISLEMGESGHYGAAKIIEEHPELASELPRLVSTAELVEERRRRATLKNKGVTFKLVKEGDKWVLAGAEVEGANYALPDPDLKPKKAATSADMRDRYENKIPAKGDKPIEKGEALKEAITNPQGVADRTDEVLSKLPGWTKVKELIKTGAINVPELLHRESMMFFTRQQLADIGETYLPQIKEYENEARRLDADRNELVFEAAEVAKEYSEFLAKNKKEEAFLSRLMSASTIEMVDASEDKFSHLIDPIEGKDRIKVLYEVAYGRSGEGTNRWVNEANHIYAQMQADKRREKVHPILNERFKALSPKGQEMYIKVRDFYASRYRKTSDELEARVERAELPGSEKRRMKEALRLKFEMNQVAGVYFPLGRHGEYWVALKNEQDEVSAYRMFDTRAEQQGYIDALKMAGEKFSHGRKIETAPGLKGASEKFMGDIMGIVEHIKGEAALEINDAIMQLWLQSLPDISVRKKFIHRKKISGFSMDALRSLADNGFHGSYQLAKIMHGDKLERMLNQMDKARHEATDTEAAATIHEELVERHQWMMNPTTAPWTSKVSSMGFLWFLGGSVAAAGVNMTQTPLVALPVLGAEFGFDKAAKALSVAAFKDFATGNKMKKGKRLEGFKEGILSLSENLQGEELKAYHELVRSGVIDKTLTHDLIGQAETPSAVYSGKTQKVMGAIGWAFHHAERFNREVTAIAAYRLARESGMGFDQAVAKAADMTWTSHFDYSNANKARFMQGDVARVIFMFKQYSQNMIYRLARDTQQSLAGESKEVKRLARRRLGGILTMHAMAAGSLGLPWVLVAPVIAAIYALPGVDDDDEMTDSETEFLNNLTALFGEDAAKAIAYGIPYAAGADLHSRVGLNELWFRSDDYDDRLEGSAYVQAQLVNQLGPMAGVLQNFGRGAQQMSEGRVYRGIETMMPKFIKDGMKALRYGMEGVKDIKGNLVIDDISGGEVALKFMGFNPGDLAWRYTEKSKLNSMKWGVMDKRAKAKEQAIMAMQAGDLERATEVITKFNEKHPQHAITGRDINTSMRSRAKVNGRTVDGVYLSPKFRYLRDKVRMSE